MLCNTHGQDSVVIPEAHLEMLCHASVAIPEAHLEMLCHDSVATPEAHLEMLCHDRVATPEAHLEMLCNASLIALLSKWTQLATGHVHRKMVRTTHNFSGDILKWV